MQRFFVEETRLGIPVLDIGRDPRWGRTEESWGEDPCLSARYAVAAVRGAQGEGPSIDLGFDHLSFYNEAMKRVVEPGEFDIMVGSDSTAMLSVLLTVSKGDLITT